MLIVDSAGRLHIDDELMAEIQQVHAAISPVETLFVVDSMTGQDAVNSARAFDQALSLTGVILTKTDGDARGRRGALDKICNWQTNQISRGR